MNSHRTRAFLRRAAPVGLGLALLASAAPATGAGDPARAALARSRADAARLSAKADAIRADLMSGSFERAIARLAAMAGLDVPVTPEPSPSPSLALLPAGLRAPVADLLAAATYSAEGMRRAIRADDGASVELAGRTGELGHRISLALARGERWPAERARRLKAQVVASPVLAAAARGGLAIGAALDRSLEPLRLAAAALPRSTRPAGACDVVDQRPSLCVNGTGPNAIDAEAVLVIDLGGDDTYTSSAGGANSARCVDDPEDTSCSTSVLIELGGSDTYLLDRAVSHDHLVGAGAGLLGVGVLVDAGGDDAYLAHVPDRERSLDASAAFGSASTGLGLLADLAGDDRYELTGGLDDIASPYTHGSALNGMGALLDLDGANTYLVHQRGTQTPVPGNPLGANDFALAMGVGIFGAGALVDRTGYATLSARIEGTAGTQADMNIVNTVTHGTGLVGEGALFAGAGPTLYEGIARRVATASLPGQSADPEPDEVGFVEPVAHLPGGAYATGMGVGAAGFAAFEDAGGDDTYTTHARSEHHLTVTAEDGCGCDRAIATLDTTGFSDFFGGYSDEAGAGVSTQGLGSAIIAPDAGAILHDRGGDDTYSARSELIITARAENRLASGSALAEAIPIRTPDMSAFGQGLGSDFAPTVLQDDGGDDSYELITLNRTHASASAAGGPESARALGATTATHGQGASYWDPAHGTLLDTGGRDTYAAHAISRATASPNAGTWDLPRTIGAQGAVGGLLADLDDGLADAFTATPERGPGVGVRGEGPGWVDVLNIFPGYGIAPLQPARREVAITMDPSNPSRSSGGFITVRARLTEAGRPVAGRELTFDLDFKGTDLAMRERWSSWGLRGHGITDEDGWATGTIDVGTAIFWADDEWRLAARFHGDGGRRTALGTQPFDIEAPPEE